MKILVDQMYQNIFLELERLNYDVESVDILIREGKKLKSDYSILKYAELNNMILITRDGQNVRGCDENDILCIALGENPDIAAVIQKIGIIESSKPIDVTPD